METTIEVFNSKMNEYMNEYVRNNMYMIEYTKCCGYGCFSTIYKDTQLIELYRNASIHFGTNSISSLYIITPSKQKIVLPISGFTTFRQFLMTQISDSSNPGMVPIYPLPAHIVYRVYVEDGHCHCHEH
jgi:hypothetical protein